MFGRARIPPARCAPLTSPSHSLDLPGPRGRDHAIAAVRNTFDPLRSLELPQKPLDSLSHRRFQADGISQPEQLVGQSRRRNAGRVCAEYGTDVVLDRSGLASEKWSEHFPIAG